MAHTARTWSVFFAGLAAVLGICAAVIEVSLDHTNGGRSPRPWRLAFRPPSAGRAAHSKRSSHGPTANPQTQADRAKP
jgi:hypothetical protein